MPINIGDLLKEAKENAKSPWEHINHFLEVDLKRRLLAISEHQEILKNKDGEAKLADKLGLARATLFHWKKDPDLKDSFPRRNPRGRPLK